MPSNKENTNPKTLRAAQNINANPTSSTTYSRTPGAVGLRGWQPPQPHMFASTAPASGFSTTSFSKHSNVNSTSDLVHAKHVFSPVEGRPHSRTDSPLKVRKTRENLRSAFSHEVIPNNAYSVPDLAYGKFFQNHPPGNIQDPAFNAAAKSLIAVTRFSQESHGVHVATEQTSSKRASVESNNSDRQSAPSLSRRLSVRKRVVSKVKGGLLNRSKSSAKIPSQDDSQVANGRAASEQERSVQSSASEVFCGSTEEYAMLPRPAASDPYQSLIPEEILGDSPGPFLDETAQILPDSDPALPRSDESFPSSLQTTEPSPSPEKTPRPARRSIPSPKDHRIATSREIGMLHVNLAVTPAWTTLDLADKAVMWAMIKAEATVSLDPASMTDNGSTYLAKPPRHVSRMSQSLDAIVIIDNSPLASPLAIKSMCEFIRTLCSLLRHDRDHLAVFCTRCPHESQDPQATSGCRLHCLQKPNLMSLSKDLAKLETSEVVKPSSTNDDREMLQEAVSSLTESREDATDRNTHAFVISPLPRKCARELQRLVPWPIHQIQVGYCYDAPTSRDQGRTCGWYLELETADDAALEKLIHSAREGAQVEELSHVRVSINSTPPYRVEKLLTPPRKAKLRPGQCTTLFAKVQIPSILNECESDTTSLDSLYKALYQALGNVKNELFKADVRYRHSLLSQNTELRVEQTCELIRTNRDSQWGAIREQGDDSGMELEIEKAKFAARNYPPDIAIRILQKKFGDLWSGRDGPEMLHHLREELEFQKRALSELSGKFVQLSTGTATRHQILTGKRRTTLHVPETEALQIFNTAPSTPTPEEGNTSTATSSAEHLHFEGKQESFVEQDEARRIWRHMRRNSRTTSGPSSASEASSRVNSATQQQRQRRGSQESVIDRMAAADARLKEIRLKAIQNKRSVGAETLRDFGMMQQDDDDEQEEVQYEACVPWL